MAEGTVASMWRYPVKSMMGEELNSSDITDRGRFLAWSLRTVGPLTGRASIY